MGKTRMKTTGKGTSGSGPSHSGSNPGVGQSNSFAQDRMRGADPSHNPFSVLALGAEGPETDLALAKAPQRFQDALSELRGCEAWVKLYDAAGRPAITSTDQDTHWDGEQLCINDKEKGATLLESIIMETCNGASNAKLEQIRDDLLKYDNSDDFAEAIEKVEFDNTQIVAGIMGQLGRAPELTFDSFGEYQHEQQSTGHTANYKREYNFKKPAYELDAQGLVVEKYSEAKGENQIAVATLEGGWKVLARREYDGPAFLNRVTEVFDLTSPTGKDAGKGLTAKEVARAVKGG